MPDPRLRINAGPPLRAALAASGGEFPTGRVNAIAERYLAMIEAARPALSRQEWLAIFAALYGPSVHEGVRAEGESASIPTWSAASLALEIADADRLNGIGETWGIDAQDLARRLHAMPDAARIAIVETAERFWALASLPDSAALDLATSHPATWPQAEAVQRR